MVMESLFPVGTLAGPDDVVDREDYIDFVTYELLSGQSVMIAGPRRIGKSSVAHEILRRLEAKGCMTCSIDLFFVSSLEEFATKLAQKICEHRWGPINVAARTWRSFLDVFQKVIIRRGNADLEFEIQLPLQRDAEPYAILYAALEMAQQLAKKRNSRFIILLDEFQELDSLGGTPLLKKLRSIFQQQTHCTYLFLGSKPSMLKTIFADRRQAFYRFAVQRDLPPIPKEAWEEYLTRKFRLAGKTITPAALSMLIEETGGHPHSVMQVANYSHVISEVSETSTINADLIAYSIDKTLDAMHSTYEAQWNEIRTIKNAAEIVLTIAEGGRPYSLDLDPGKVSRVIRALQQIAIIEKKDRGIYHFVEPLFARWLRENVAK
mgnify:CR=1 FL=1